MTTFETYGAYTRCGEGMSDNGYNYEVDNDDWSELQEYIQTMEAPTKSVTRSQGIEEAPPRIRPQDGAFQPYGWVGEYPGGIEVVPDKVDDNSYKQLVDESRGLIESFGLRTAVAALPFSPDVLADARALYLRYSQSLIELTEELVSERLPLNVQEETHVGNELRGRPLFAQTVTIRSQGRPKTVSRSVSFNFETSANKLLVLFHRELRSRLASLIFDFEVQNKLIQRRLGYHENFLTNVIPEELRERKIGELELTINEQRALTETATGPVTDMVDLWDAYRRQLSTELDPAERYDSALKPASKVYELWCLLQILGILREEFGGENEGQSRGKLPSVFTFGDRIKLYYDRSLTQNSNYLKPLLRPASNLRAGAPDFILTVDGTPRWIADAKFQRQGEVGLGGAQRFISYVVDYLKQSIPSNSTLLCVSETGEIKEGTIEGYRFSSIGFGPKTAETTSSILQDEILRVI